MKKIILNSIFLLSVSAQAAMTCQTEVTDFLKTYRESVSDCNDFDDQEACDRICSKMGSKRSVIDDRNVSVGTAGTCRPEELRLATAEAEKRTLEKVRADLNAEGSSRGSAVGASEQDCLDKATAKAQAGATTAVEQCNNRSTYFKNCAIVGSKVIKAPTAVVPFRQRGKVEDEKIDEATCRIRAQEKATQNAIQVCRQETGADCRISTPATAATHQTDRRRRYVIAGPKDTYHTCESFAEALPDASARFQCSIELSAKNRF